MRRSRLQNATAARALVERGQVLNTILAPNGTTAFVETLRHVQERGEPVGKTRDLLSVHIEIADPEQGFVYAPKQHWVWALYEMSDRLNPDFKNPGNAWRFRSTWRKKLEAEGGQFCYTYGDVFKQQLPPLLARLRKKQTREAIITMWEPKYLHEDVPRTPCTLALHFLIRDSRLFLMANMRTNDVVNLLPYDLWHHTFLQTYIAARLSLNLGFYTHTTDHAYYPKRRDTTGIISRLIWGCERLYPKHDLSTHGLFTLTLNEDIHTHYLALRMARDGSLAGALDLAQGIAGIFIREWTTTLVVAEAKLRGHSLECPMSLPMFSYIHELKYGLK